MSLIYCYINLFDADQEIYLINGSDDKKLIAKTPLNNISKVLPDLCRDKDCYDVHLYGLDVVATEMANKISKEEMKHYSERKIKVEVNK